jgi:hypothetical protein
MLVLILTVVVAANLVLGALLLAALFPRSSRPERPQPR